MRLRSSTPSYRQRPATFEPAVELDQGGSDSRESANSTRKDHARFATSIAHRPQLRLLGGLDLPDHTAPGDAARGRARRRAAEFAGMWSDKYPRAVACVTDDLASLRRSCGPAWARAKHPPHQPDIERTFGESSRRVKVIGRLPGERSCLSLVWAVLDRAQRG
jgi:hypothetical protein